MQLFKVILQAALHTSVSKAPLVSVLYCGAAEEACGLQLWSVVPMNWQH